MFDLETHDHKRTRLALEFKVDEAVTDGTFSGYGSVFGNVDHGGDMIVQGAFGDWIAQAKRDDTLWPDMLLQHGYGWTSNDMTPIGVWTKMEEDTVGLRLEGQLCLDVARARDTYNLMKMKPRRALRGLSIGYWVKREDVEYGDDGEAPRRTIKKVFVDEVSIVTKAMNPLAKIDEVKSLGDPAAKRLLEGFLRDAGASREEAKAFIAGGFDALRLRDAGTKGNMELLESLQGLRSIFQR